MLQGLKVTWLGHATFLLETAAGKKILVDPWLGGNPACPEAFHKVQVDSILITHGHGDHIGDVFTAHEQCDGPIVGIFDLTTWLGGKGVNGEKLVGMNKGGTIRLDAIGASVTMTHAIHSSSFVDEGQMVYLGEAAGFVVKFDDGPTLYIAGDTDVFGDMALIGKRFRPDVAILPIGDHFTMGPDGAALACELLGVKAVIPCHYATFPLLTGTPDALQHELKALSLDTAVLRPEVGQAIS